MRAVPLLLVLVGALLALAGLVFTLQGMGIVGPDSSLMFLSQTWVYQGVVTMAVGAVILAAGALAARKKRAERA